LFPYANTVTHRSGIEANGSLYTPSSLQGAFSGQNCDGAPTSKADNTSNAVIDHSDVAQRLEVGTYNIY